MTPACQVGGDDSMCWHHLSDEQSCRIAFGKWLVITWVSAIDAAGSAIPRPFCEVLKLLGTGPAVAHMYALPNVFGS